MRRPVSTPKAPGGNSAVAFDKETGLRVLDATRYVEGMKKNGVPARRQRQDGGGAILILVVTTDIGAKAGTIAGQGQANVASFNRSTGALGSGSGAALPVYNYHEKKFIAGAIIAAFWWAGVLWAFDVDKCANYQ